MKQSSLLWNYGVVSPTILAAIVGVGVSAIATEVNSPQLTSSPPYFVEGGDSSEKIWEQINHYSNETNALEQVTNVSQLRDVSPGDWAYEALRSLVELTPGIIWLTAPDHDSDNKDIVIGSIRTTFSF